MDTFALFGLITMTVRSVLGIKLVYDQQVLQKNVREI
jgi:hypothetical protein